MPNERHEQPSDDKTTQRCQNESASDERDSPLMTTDTDTETRHPMPWLGADYGSVDRVSLLDTATDSDTPVSQPTAETAQTGFNPRDVSSHRRQRWQWLERQHQKFARETTDERTARHYGGIEREIDIVCGHLDCTEHQQTRSKWLLETLDIQDDVDRTASIEAVVMAVVTLVVNEDNRRVRTEESYRQLRVDYGIATTEIRRLRQAIRETTVYQSQT